MSDFTSQQGPPADQEKKSSKKPYRKPDYRHERVFETMALQCGKISSTQPQCRNNTKTS